MSNGDKRKVSTDALETLGTIITDKEKRDAIHLAVIPAEAGMTLKAGQYITLENGVATADHRGLGIVDPFVMGEINAGQMFWMVLKPRTITSLRHVWSHPDLPDEPGAGAPTETDEILLKAASEQMLRDWIRDADAPSYEEFLAAAVSYHNDEECLHFGTDAHGDIPAWVWDHVEIVTGKKVSNRPTYFSCSC